MLWHGFIQDFSTVTVSADKTASPPFPVREFRLSLVALRESGWRLRSRIFSVFSRGSRPAWSQSFRGRACSEQQHPGGAKHSTLSQHVLGMTLGSSLLPLVKLKILVNLLIRCIKGVMQITDRSPRPWSWPLRQAWGISLSDLAREA